MHVKCPTQLGVMRQTRAVWVAVNSDSLYACEIYAKPAPGWKNSCLDVPCRFAAAEGDLVTYLNIWRAWCEAGRDRRWSHRHCLNHRNLLRAADIREQLEYRCRSSPGNQPPPLPLPYHPVPPSAPGWICCPA